jgi:methyltransferase (TIGR00027 family)
VPRALPTGVRPALIRASVEPREVAGGLVPSAPTKKVKVIRRILSFLVYIPLQIAFIPLAIVGVVIATYKQLMVSKRLGVSSTGIEIIQGRWTMHWFGIRKDEPTARLASALPNATKVGLWLALAPLWVAHKLSGTHFLYPRVPVEGNETMADFVVARTLYFDRIIERVAPEVEQFVVLGAGYDARPYGGLKREGLRFFELDQEPTQKLKVASLARAGIESGHVTFVTVDFRQDDPFTKLEEAGYDPSKKTLFLWEGVTLYLTEADVRRTLRDIREHSAAGSTIVADIYGSRMIEFGSKGGHRKALEYTGEELSFGLQFAADFQGELERLVNSEHMTVGETVFLGRHDPKGPLLVVAEIRV